MGVGGLAFLPPVMSNDTAQSALTCGRFSVTSTRRFGLRSVTVATSPKQHPVGPRPWRNLLLCAVQIQLGSQPELSSVKLLHAAATAWDANRITDGKEPLECNRNIFVQLQLDHVLHSREPELLTAGDQRGDPLKTPLFTSAEQLQVAPFLLHLELQHLLQQLLPKQFDCTFRLGQMNQTRVQLKSTKRGWCENTARPFTDILLRPENDGPDQAGLRRTRVIDAVIVTGADLRARLLQKLHGSSPSRFLSSAVMPGRALYSTAGLQKLKLEAAGEATGEGLRPAAIFVFASTAPLKNDLQRPLLDGGETTTIKKKVYADMSEQRDKPISHHYEEACRQRSKPPQQQVASPHPVIKACGTIVNTLLLAQILAESRGAVPLLAVILDPLLSSPAVIKASSSSSAMARPSWSEFSECLPWSPWSDAPLLLSSRKFPALRRSTSSRFWWLKPADVLRGEWAELTPGTQEYFPETGSWSFLRVRLLLFVFVFSSSPSLVRMTRAAVSQEERGSSREFSTESNQPRVKEVASNNIVEREVQPPKPPKHRKKKVSFAVWLEQQELKISAENIEHQDASPVIDNESIAKALEAGDQKGDRPTPESETDEKNQVPIKTCLEEQVPIEQETPEKEQPFESGVENVKKQDTSLPEKEEGGQENSFKKEICQEEPVISKTELVDEKKNIPKSQKKLIVNKESIFKPQETLEQKAEKSPSTGEPKDNIQTGNLTEVPDIEAKYPNLFTIHQGLSPHQEQLKPTSRHKNHCAYVTEKTVSFTVQDGAAPYVKAEYNKCSWAKKCPTLLSAAIQQRAPLVMLKRSR
ncbi:hypothetical protein CCH79_00006491 [Gambusia affinis]|uniref:Uncharacterized protein n=1 Tax=Gambusia affinis TaxID=33528 RepID=A0A315WPU2_GAMAF|nr:hypothetical protein CCH79_00006491 [Gambusia affinis]